MQRKFSAKSFQKLFKPMDVSEAVGGRVLDAGKEAVGEWPDASPSLCRCSPERIFDLGRCGGAVWLWLWQQLAGRQSFAGVVVFSRPSRDKTHQWIQRGTFRLFLPLSALPCQSGNTGKQSEVALLKRCDTQELPIPGAQKRESTLREALPPKGAKQRQSWRLPRRCPPGSYIWGGALQEARCGSRQVLLREVGRKGGRERGGKEVASGACAEVTMSCGASGQWLQGPL